MSTETRQPEFQTASGSGNKDKNVLAQGWLDYKDNRKWKAVHLSLVDEPPKRDIYVVIKACHNTSSTNNAQSWTVQHRFSVRFVRNIQGHNLSFGRGFGFDVLHLDHEAFMMRCQHSPAAAQQWQDALQKAQEVAVARRKSGAGVAAITHAASNGSKEATDAQETGEPTTTKSASTTEANQPNLPLDPPEPATASTSTAASSLLTHDGGWWTDPQLTSPAAVRELTPLFDQWVHTLAHSKHYEPAHVGTTAKLWLVCTLLLAAHDQNFLLSPAQRDCVQLTREKSVVMMELLDLYTDTPLELLSTDRLVVTHVEKGVLAWQFSSTIEFDKEGLLEEESQLIHMADTPIPETEALSDMWQQWHEIQGKIRNLWGTQASSSRQPSTPPEPKTPEPNNPQPEKRRSSIAELRALAHGAGIVTAGMERAELERVIADLGRRWEQEHAKNGTTNTTASSHPPANRRSISELCDVAQRAGVVTSGMLRDELERVVEQVERQQKEEHARKLKAQEDERLRREREAVTRKKEQEAAETFRQQQKQEADARAREEEARARAEEARRKKEAVRREQAAARKKEEAARRAQHQAEIQRMQENHRRQQVETFEQQRRQSEAQRLAQQQEAFRRQQEAARLADEVLSSTAEQERRRQREAAAKAIAAAWQNSHQSRPQPHHSNGHYGGQYGWAAPSGHAWHATPPPPPNLHPGHHPMSHTPPTASQPSSREAQLRQAILAQWALQPPALQKLKCIRDLVASIHAVLPPFMGVVGHKHFAGWAPAAPADLGDSRLPKTIRKLRLILHPDRLPKDLSSEQKFVCDLLWHVVSDALHEYENK